MFGSPTTWVMIALALVAAAGCAAREHTPNASRVPDRQLRAQQRTASAFKTPVPIDRPFRNYPSDELARGREGWVRICLRVEADGSTSNIQVADTSGYETFEKRTIDAIARWRFEPAQLYGEPVPYDDVCIFFGFWIERGPGFDRSFKKKVRHILQLIEQRDLAAAEAEMSVLREREFLTRLEQSDLYSTEFFLQSQRGDRLAAVRALELVGLIGGLSLSRREEYGRHRQSLFVLYAQLGWYTKALETYEELRRDQVDVSAIEATAQSISKLIDGNGDIAASARIDAMGWSAARCWRHEPIRRELAITDLDGKIEEIAVLCERRSDSVNPPEGVVWKIPESWGACRLRICGAYGTSFRLIEYGREAPTESH